MNILNFFVLRGFYEQLKPLADFGPEFQRLRKLRGNENEALAEIATFPKDARSVCSQLRTALFMQVFTAQKTTFSIP
jgi:hypothetical protein